VHGIVNRVAPPFFRTLLHYMLFLFSAALLVLMSMVLLNYPWAVDGPPPPKVRPPVSSRAALDFYGRVYQRPTTASGQVSNNEDDSLYVRTARQAAREAGVKESVTDFVLRYNLRNAHVLEVGAGSGLLQDVVSDYTGSDIAGSAGRYFHKKFVVASATDLPFPDNEFDSVWSIWVFEHVPTPEWAFLEMRRVVRDNGLLYVAPAWNCDPLAAQGYGVRPWSDFDLAGKLIKASVPIRRSLLFRKVTTPLPVHLVRYCWWFLFREPTSLRYKRLTPGYDHYWVEDSDAVNSIDSYEAYLWFLSRGDQCLNCSSNLRELRVSTRWPMIIRVRKFAARR
jgi:SAM-dependent methyltransferase